MEALRANGGALELADGVVINPRQSARCALVTHASRVADAARSELAFVPEPLAHALPDGHRATIVRLDERFTAGEFVATYVSAGKTAGVQVALARDDQRVTVLTGAMETNIAPVPCSVLLLEATYALPVYRWPGREELADTLRSWLQLNRDAGRAAVLAAEPTDEARLLHELAAQGIVFAHDTIARFIPGARRLDQARKRDLAGELVLIPPSALDDGTCDRIGPHETALASGRMRVRGNRRRAAIDRGFVLSSRADWPTLMRAIEVSGAREVFTFGAHAVALARASTDRGRAARPLAGGER